MIFSQKKDKFFVQLTEMAEHLKKSSDFFHAYEKTGLSDLKDFAGEMKKLESQGDTMMHELIRELNKTFITPIEREDILQLGMKMDDVLDGMEQVSSRCEMYSIAHRDEYMKKFIDYIQLAIEEISKALELLSNKKLLSIRQHAITIKDYESKCDEVLRTSIKQLFVKEKDVIKIIQVKELYELLEQVSDSCQDVANTLESIIMRNA